MEWVCSLCGYVDDGELAPDVCPVCGAPGTSFGERYSDEAEQSLLGNGNGDREVDEFEKDLFADYDE